MKRSRDTVTLSDSVHHQLNMYALAASAAGVSVLALAQPAECKIIYTHACAGSSPDAKLPSQAPMGVLWRISTTSTPRSSRRLRVASRSATTR
jgi:hypothetical protein